MKLLRSLLVFILSLVMLHNSCFIIHHAFADSQNYSTSYDTTYTIAPDGTTHASMKIGLKNTTSKYYASSYKLLIGFDDVSTIRGFDNEGAITPILKRADDGYQVELQFNDKVVGVGNTLYFTLSFDTKSIAKKQGDVWVVNIPSTANQEAFSDFKITVKPPAVFGEASLTRPESKNGSLSFTKDELGAAGVSIIFGNQQTYLYDLTYHLKNNNVFPIKTEIALPPSTNYQESTLSMIVPKPENITRDADGNWMAQYSMSPGEKVDVRAKGTTQVFLTPKPAALTTQQKELYTKEQPYWQATPEVKKLASELRTPEKIYEYVTKTLRYDFSRRGSDRNRLGAKDILKHPDHAVCLEFTDLFIALARSAGIPAREVDGYAFTDNESERPLSLVPDILHAWPEYYDFEKKTWVMIDPTWGNTTNGMDYFSHLDLDHVTYAIKGASSSYPIPAGGYKLAGKESEKDISMEFTDRAQDLNQQVILKPEIEDVVLSGFPISGNIVVTNTGNAGTHEQKIQVISSTLTPRRQSIIVPSIPPQGRVVVKLSFDKTPFLTKGKHTFTMSIQGKEISQDISVTPFLLTGRYFIIGAAIGILTLIILIIAYQTGRLPFPRR